MTNTLQVNELDFDDIKAELITFLSGQTEFQDYDFTGSALNTLIDVCAYLIHYVGVQSNFALRESFLESAQLRKNVAALAKQLGYFPSQAKAARASFTLRLDLTGETQPAELVVPKGITFSSTFPDGTNAPFTTFDDNPMVDSGLAAGGPANEIWEGTVFVAQGTFAEQFWTVTGSSDQRYIIEQEGVDTDFLTVIVKPTQASTTTTIWNYAKSLTEVGPASEAFFLSEVGDDIEIYFGNNVVGKALATSNYIMSEYLVTQGSLANGIREFSLDQAIAGYPREDFEIVSGSVLPASDGAERETINSIRFVAPLSYQRQNRIVTIEDYKAAILENYSNVKAINVWGGEDAIPPEYGKVFVSIAPVFGDTVSPTTKKSIEEDVLSRFSVVGITPEIVDPEYLYINLDTTVIYNKDRTTDKASQVATAVRGTIEDFFDSQVFDYNQSFKYSRALAAMDATHQAITNSLSEITISKKFIPIAGVSGTYELKYYNELKPGTVISVPWVNASGQTLTIKDNSNGKLELFSGSSKIKTNLGTVDYVNGIINLPGFNPNMLVNGTLEIIAEPDVFDVEVLFNSLGRLGTNTVTAVAEVR